MHAFRALADRLKTRLPVSLRPAARRVRGLIRVSKRDGRAPSSPVQPRDFVRRSLGPSPLATSDVTNLLFDRLSAADVQQVESRSSDEQRSTSSSAGRRDRKRVLLAVGVHHQVAGVLEKTGLSSATPDDEVHAMGRGWLAAGGSYYYADLVVDALNCSSLELKEGVTGLDFGCSSGRVVRVLAAAHPEVRWHGCDPIESSIAWANANLPGIEFASSPSNPPLRYEHDRFDFAYAISIWSHFAESAAIRWLDEMRRVIRRGGCLVLTAHGVQSIAHYASKKTRSLEHLSDINRALYRDGFWFAPEFGERGDHGLVSHDWGTAFFTPEWLAGRLFPDWRLLQFAPGRAEDNQDLYVLERC